MPIPRQKESLPQNDRRITMTDREMINTTYPFLSSCLGAVPRPFARHTRNRVDDPSLIPSTYYGRRLSPHSGLYVLSLLKTGVRPITFDPGLDPLAHVLRAYRPYYGDYRTTTQPLPGIPDAYRTSRYGWLWEPLILDSGPITIGCYPTKRFDPDFKPECPSLRALSARSRAGLPTKGAAATNTPQTTCPDR